MPTIDAPFTEEQYLALCAAIVNGSKVVRYGDKTVEYRSLDEMLRIKGIMEEALGINNSGNGRRVADFNRGY